MDQDYAERIAIKALGWLAADEELLMTFLGASGADIDSLRSAAADPHFLGAVLDFVMMDDAWVTRFCNDAALPPEMPMRARQALPGGAQVHWT
ncbi:DUF3572 domain-containing protein [Profundibacterium mesophilum]|uniref:DUF3572 domain-containing protein n=1 Tax=Profundibacterium mesophilum KAUST100406-0324 TaxID=1037889 RepID=A0A921TCV4_9RHOB|nr:DUF3572 domain-containing protein [Profundibacterium mesophilum]KAF0677580.1 hypothetical protein PMES_00085 [Profundibacterium mesophilum KAUST100406-0324]